MRQIAYGACADQCDEYARVSETVALISLKEFCLDVVESFGGTYLRSPTLTDIINIQERFSSLGFPSCIGTIDCSSWQ